MPELVVITPSRGRPQQLAALADAVAETTRGRVEVIGCVDNDDPQLSAYEALLPTPGPAPYAPLRLLFGERRSLSTWTNQAAQAALLAPDPPRYLASLGDDHRPRTPDWDLRLVEAMEGIGGSGISYGNDLLQGPALPTAWVVSADIVAAVGWMMLPACAHLYVDNAVLELGRAADRIVYRPDVIIEHLHPMAGKAAWDGSYRESNARTRDAVDGAAFARWREDPDGLAADAATIRQAVTAG